MDARENGAAAIFVLPTTTSGQLGPVAGWISTCGWAAAAERELGCAWIVTPQGILTVDEVRRRAAGVERSLASSQRRARRAIPSMVKTLAKDGREALRARRFSLEPLGPWTDTANQVEFVWQRHELFHRAGLDLAAALDVPSVLFVPALLMWQAKQWAVRRPLWGQWLETKAELPALRAATLIACGSQVVAQELLRLGIAEERVIITPTGVDVELFAGPIDRAAARQATGVGDGFVVGWAGSFRPFHALDQLVRAAAGVAGLTLLLVGDGPERPRIEQLTKDLGVRARFTGIVPHDELPQMLAAMDVGVVLGRADEPFHYSPLKLAEYLAAGLPVVAPAVPQLTERLDDGRNVAFFQPGDAAGLTAVLRALSEDSDQRSHLAEGGRTIAHEWSWDQQVRRVRNHLANNRH